MSLSQEQKQNICSVLKEMGRWQEGSTLQVEGDRRSGKQDKSSVHQLKVRDTASADTLDLIVKFDEPERMKKEVEALTWLARGNKPHCVLYNLDGPSGLKIMAEHGLILYEAAHAHATGDELLSLETLLEHQGRDNQANCQKALALTLAGLAAFHGNQVEYCNDPWLNYFEKVKTQLLELKERASEPLRSALGQLGSVGRSPMGKIHGDLNLSNILVTLVQHAPTYVSLIDFAEAQRRAPICIDLARLEMALWLDVIPAEHHPRLAKALSAGSDLKGLDIPGLKTVLALRQTLDQQVAKVVDGNWAAYRTPLLLWFLRAYDFQTVEVRSKALVLALAEREWQAIERERSGRGADPPPLQEPSLQPDQDPGLATLVEAKITAVLERDCWRPCWPILTRELVLQASIKLAGVAKYLMTRELAEVCGKLIGIFNEAEHQASPYVWEAGLEVISWLVVLRVKNVGAADLENLPVSTLLGTELVIAKQNNRRMMVEDRRGRPAGEHALDVVEAGPIKSDWVKALSEQLKNLLPGCDVKELKRIKGAFHTAAISKQPYYVVVDGPEHPLASPRLCNYLKQHLPALVIVRLRSELADELRLVVEEEYLEGVISEYLGKQSAWEQRYYRGGNRG